MGSGWRLIRPRQALIRPPRTRSTPTSPQAATSRAVGTRPWGERPDAGVDSAAADLIPSRRPEAWRRAPVLLPAKEGLQELRYAGCRLTPSHDADVALVRALRVELVSKLALVPNACA
ncbi:unnamed protein product [Urochloa humidicola]